MSIRICFRDADNWSTAKSNKKAKNHPHALIESDEAKLKAAHPDLVTKSNAPCNVPSEKFELLKHRQEMKSSSSTSEAAFDKLVQQDSKLNKIKPIIETAHQRRLIDQFNYRQREEKDTEETIDGLTSEARWCDKEQTIPFYCPILNAANQHNKFFMMQGPKMDELLLSCKSYSFDSTFSMPECDQLAVLVAIIDSGDITRSDTVVPVFYSAMTSKSTEAYQELWRCFRKNVPDGFVMDTCYADTEHAIRTSLNLEFENTKVRLCAWHILKSWQS